MNRVQYAFELYWNCTKNVLFEVLTAVTMQSTPFWDVTFVCITSKFADIWEELTTSILGVENWSKQATSKNRDCCVLHAGCLHDLFFNPEDGGQYVPKKYR
jgi:hypothetical protein